MEKTEADVVRKYIHDRWNAIKEQTMQLVLNKEKVELIVKHCNEAEEKMMAPEDCPNLTVVISTMIRDSVMHRSDSLTSMGCHAMSPIQIRQMADIAIPCLCGGTQRGHIYVVAASEERFKGACKKCQRNIDVPLVDYFELLSQRA